MTSPLRGTPPRPTISSPVVPPPGIPPIPAIRAIPAIPAIPSLPNLPTITLRAETDPEERPDSFDPGVDQATVSRAPLEVGDNTSQTNMSFGMVTADEVEAAMDDAGALKGPVPDTSPTGEPVGRLGLHDGDEASSPETNPDAVPAHERPTTALPVPIAIPAPTPVVRDRPMPKLPISTAPDSLPPPRDSKQHATGPSPACPQCESPMAWVEEHLRFYCKSCRMYF
jgi:hypothetical protein